MEIYDTANRLAEEIKKSQQYNLFKNTKEELFSDPETKNKIEEFEKLKQEIQILELKRENNQEIDEEEKRVKVAKLYNVLVEDKKIKDFFDYEIAFNKMMYDINKIIGDAIKDVIN